MKQPIHNEQLNKVLLKPRFKIELDQSQEEIFKKFKSNLEDENCKYCSKKSGNHIFMDVPEVEQHFWSPQLQVEVLESGKGKSIIKGILGPKPQVWTLFMFIHFILALAFVVFFVIFYVKWSMDKNYQFYKYMLIAIPLIWIAMYFIGQFGKKLAYKQMVELDSFLMRIIDKD